MEGVARIVSMNGEAYAQVGSDLITLRAGSEVPEHATIITKDGAHVEIKFVDDTTVSVGPESKLTIDDYVYRPDDASASNLLLKMSTGVFRTVTGKIAAQNPDHFKLKSPLATIGIRGTVVVSQIKPDGQEMHGCEDIGRGHTLVIQDAMGSVRFITQPMNLVSLTPGQPLGEVHPLTQDVLQYFQSVTPIVSVEVRAPGSEGEGGRQYDHPDNIEVKTNGGETGHTQGDADKMMDSSKQGGDEAGDSLGKKAEPSGGELLNHDADSQEHGKPEDLMDQTFHSTLPGSEMPAEVKMPEPPGDTNLPDFLHSIESQTGDVFSEQPGENPVLPEITMLTGHDAAFLTVEQVVADAPVLVSDSENTLEELLDINNIANFAIMPDMNEIDLTIYYQDTLDTVVVGDQENDLPEYGDTLDTGINDGSTGLSANTLEGTTGNDTLIGSSGNDYISGGEGNDVLHGEAGNDTIDGGTGNDFISGGAGSDFLVGGEGDDTISGESPTPPSEAGNDTIDGGDGFDYVTYADLHPDYNAGIHLNFGDGQVTLQGGAEIDHIVNIEGVIGSDFDDTLEAGTYDADKLVFEGRGGNDFIDGGTYTDNDLIASYRSAETGVNVNLSSDVVTVADGLGGTDTLQHINGVFGSDYNDTFTGVADHDNIFQGFAGDDFIDGGTLSSDVDNIALYVEDPSGIDVHLTDFSGSVDDGYGNTDTLNNINVIVGSEHNDTFSLATTSATDVDYVVVPGEGNDSISIASGTSVIVSYEHADDPLLITLDSSGTTVFTDPWGDTDTIYGNAAIEGTEHGDTITGNDQNNLFIASEGSDYYDGAGGTDEINYFHLGDKNESGVEVVLQASDKDSGYALHDKGDATDTLIGIEHVNGTDFGDTLKGDMNSSNGVFHATLAGDGGNDLLVDGYGNDALYGDDGNDTFYLTEGNDSIYGGNGIDRLNASGLSASIHVDLTSSSFNYTIGGTEFSGHIEGIENIDGTNYNDTIILNNDTHEVFGNAGNDSLIGGAMTDHLYGGIGNDTLDGRAGNDYLHGDIGQDTLIGGTGADTFYFNNVNEGVDWIQDFNLSEHDKILLYSQSNDSQTFNFGYTSSQYLDASDFERVESSTDSTYQGDAGTSGNAEMVLFCYIGDTTSTYQLIYDPDGSGPDTGTVIAQFSADPGTDFDNHDIYVEVHNAA